MAVVCRQRSIRRRIYPRDQSLLQVHRSKLSQPLQYRLRPSLALIHVRRKVSDSQDITRRCPGPCWGGSWHKPDSRVDHRTLTCATQPWASFVICVHLREFSCLAPIEGSWSGPRPCLLGLKRTLSKYRWSCIERSATVKDNMTHVDDRGENWIIGSRRKLRAQITQWVIRDNDECILGKAQKTEGVHLSVSGAPSWRCKGQYPRLVHSVQPVVNNTGWCSHFLHCGVRVTWASFGWHGNWWRKLRKNNQNLLEVMSCRWFPLPESVPLCDCSLLLSFPFPFPFPFSCLAPTSIGVGPSGIHEREHKSLNIRKSVSILTTSELKPRCNLDRSVGLWPVSHIIIGIGISQPQGETRARLHQLCRPRRASSRYCWTCKVSYPWRDLTPWTMHVARPVVSEASMQREAALDRILLSLSWNDRLRCGYRKHGHGRLMGAWAAVSGKMVFRRIRQSRNSFEALCLFWLLSWRGWLSFAYLCSSQWK